MSSESAASEEVPKENANRNETDTAGPSKTATAKGNLFRGDADPSSEASPIEPAASKEKPNPDDNGSDSDSSEDEGPMPTSHLSLGITTQGDEAAVKALLPYLALGFTTVDSTDGGSPHYSCGFHALQISFDAARRTLFKDDLAKFQPTNRDIWRHWFRNKTQYHKHVHSYLTKKKHLKPEDSRFKAIFKTLTTIDHNGPLNFRQMCCLLDVANAEYGVNFQLGMIYSGYRGKYDAAMGEIDYDHVTQSRLVVNWNRQDKRRDKPVIVGYVYITRSHTAYMV